MSDSFPVRKTLLAALFALGPIFSTPGLSGGRGALAGDFGFYVLSLSWSPSYCAIEGADANPQQCNPAGAEPYTFIVHGLWPQYAKGYPEYCPSGEPARVPDRLAEGYTDIMPSAGLIGHQWRKHGSCSGLSQGDYLALIRKARDKIVIPAGLEDFESEQRLSPEGVEEKFIEANPGLNESGIAVTCEGQLLEEVRICLTRDLDFRSCGHVNRESCRRSTVLMPPA